MYDLIQVMTELTKLCFTSTIVMIIMICHDRMIMSLQLLLSEEVTLTVATSIMTIKVFSQLTAIIVTRGE